MLFNNDFKKGFIMKKPFLLKYAKKCCSPGRVKEEKDFYYDFSSDMVHSKILAGNPAAIDLSGTNGPETKKCDIEKGDDNKDRRMWQ